MQAKLALHKQPIRACSDQHKDGNGSGLGRVECLGTQNRNPNLKSKLDPKTDSGQNPSPKPKPADTETHFLWQYSKRNKYL